MPCRFLSRQIRGKEQAGRQNQALPAMDADMLYSSILSLQPSLPALAGDPILDNGDDAMEDAALIETAETGRGRFQDDAQCCVDPASPGVCTPRRNSRSRSPQKCSKRDALLPIPDLQQRSGLASPDRPVLRTPTAQLKVVCSTIEDQADGDASSPADFTTPRSATFVSTPVLSETKASRQRICGGSPFHSPRKKGLPKGTLALAAAGVIPRTFLEGIADAGAQV